MVDLTYFSNLHESQNGKSRQVECLCWISLHSSSKMRKYFVDLIKLPLAVRTAEVAFLLQRHLRSWSSTSSQIQLRKREASKTDKMGATWKFSLSLKTKVLNKQKHIIHAIISNTGEKSLSDKILLFFNFYFSETKLELVVLSLMFYQW